MTREELAHLLRAAAKIAEDEDILVIGSQSILGTYSEAELPESVSISIEADLVFPDPQQGAKKADEVDGAIGELSRFHTTHHYYAQGVDLTTAKLPDGWETRVVPWHPASALPARAKCLEKHDLVISKLVAGREKDFLFATALIEAGLVDLPILIARTALLSCVLPAIRQRIRNWLDGVSNRMRRTQGSQ